MAISDFAVMPLADYKAACDAIRAKTGDSGLIVSGDMAAEIASIPAGVDMSDSTAVAADLIQDKIAYTKNGRITGSIPTKAAATYNTSTTNQTISAGQYLSGAQTIRGVKVTNLSAANIKSGVTIKVGDSADDDRITSVTGTYTGGSGSAVTLTASGSASGGSVSINFASASIGSRSIIAWEIYGGSGSASIDEAFGWGSSNGTGFAYAGSYQSSSIYHKVVCTAEFGEVIGTNKQVWFRCSTSGYSFSGSYTAKVVFG